MNTDLVLKILEFVISISGLVISIISLCKIQKIIKIINNNDIKDSYNKTNNKVETKGNNNSIKF